MILVYLSIAFILGIYCSSYYKIPLAATLTIVAVCLLAATLLHILRKKHTLRYVSSVVLGLSCIALFLCGALRFAATPTGDDIQSYIGQESASVRGIVIDEPEPGNASVKLTVRVNEINGGKASGTLLLYTERYPSYSYGDLILATGTIEEPPDDINGFNYRAYLARQGIYTTLYYPNVEQVVQGHAPQPWQAIYTLRHRLGEALRSALPEPEASLARGILLGLRGDIPPAMTEAFQRSGTTHILAISGQNMAIIAGIVLSIATRLFGKRRPTYFILTMAVLWLYALLAGMSAPVLRAVIMVSIYLLGMYLGRQRSGLTAVAFSAAIMIGLNPTLLWQISFQLSFSAVLGLILLTPIFQDWLSRLKMPKLLAESAACGLGAVIATLPLTTYYFGYTSLVTLPATFFASIALPAIIVITAIIAVTGLFWMQAARVLGWIDWLLLKYFVLAVKGFAAIPNASVGIGAIPVWLVYIYYAFIAAIMRLWSMIKRRLPVKEDKVDKKEKKAHIPTPLKWAIGALSIAAILVWAAVFSAPTGGKLQVSFLDVGQGDAILITSPDNRCIMIDGGPNPETACLGLGEALPFWERSIDLAVITHPHDDHVSGLIEIARRYDVKEVLASPDSFVKAEGTNASPAYDEFRSLIAERHIEYVAAEAGQIIDIGGGATIEVLNPPAQPLEGTSSDADNNGVVLRIAMGNVSFLLSADLYADGELRLVYDRAKLSSTVLKVGHHGSKYSTDSEYLDTVAPQAAVISVGANNRFGHPNASIVDRLARAVGNDMVFTTMDRGTITFTTDGKRLWVKTER